ncbi:MAG: NAD(P)/FAD-dependent oxidoreductase [Nitrososphaeraceae archaeon]
MSHKIRSTQARIDFSFKREVFFIVAGGIIGAIVMAIPFTFPFTGRGSGYALTWIVFGHIAGVHSPISSVIIAGILIHIVTGTSIGIISGVFLYKTNILNISKPSNGLRYGLLVGTLVYLIFAIPVEHFVLNPEFGHTLSSNNGTGNTVGYNEGLAGQSRRGGGAGGTEEGIQVQRPNNKTTTMTTTTFSNIQLNSTIYSILINLLFGITLGLFSSFLSIKFGSRYRCPACDISFSRIDILQNHLNIIHGRGNPIQDRKTILILGGGFGGVSALRKLQDYFQTDISIDIAMISKDNYLLFTPMLHEVASGMIETRHIVTPVRAFCNRSRFYAATVEHIDFDKRQVVIRSSSASPLLEKIDDPVDTLQGNTKSLHYDYLVLALGSETKFFGMSDVQKYSFTMKSLNDAITLRNHIIYLLEQADQLATSIKHNNRYKELQTKLLTFVIVGGGFAGVETAGEINDFIRDSAKDYYHNIDSKNIRVVIIQSGNRLLPEMSKELAEFALLKLRNSGLEVMLDSRVIGATEDSVKISDGNIIPTKTIVWSGGVAPNPLISKLHSCEHDIKSGRIVVDQYLEIPKYKGVYALGDCAFITDPKTGNPYPPTAQHAIREGAVVAKNIFVAIEGNSNSDGRKVFDYTTKGMMASIGKRTGVGNLLGVQVQGFLAWWIWRNYYLVNLPTLQKKVRVLADWVLDIFFKRDVTMLKTLAEEKKD